MLDGPIYTDFLQHCGAAHMLGRWGPFAKQADFRRPSSDGLATLAALRQKYARKDLLRSGVATPDTTDPHSHGSADYKEIEGLKVNPILSGPFTRILPLHASPQGYPLDLLTGEGAVSGRLPACAFLDDHRVKKGIQKTGILCLAFSIEDVMAFRSVGIPAALANGLEQFTRESLKEFCSSLVLESSSDGSVHGSSGHVALSAASTAPLQKAAVQEKQTKFPVDPSAHKAGADNPWPPRPRLFLVDWLPSQLTLRHPEGLDGVAGSLINVGKCLDVNLDDVFIWRPTAGEVHRIAYCLAKGDRKDVRKAILASLRGSSQLLGLTQGETDEPVSLLEARARLREALLRPGGKSGERRRRLRQHQEAIDNALVRPLLEEAAAEFDPMRRSQLAALAGVNQMLHPAVELYLAGQEKEVAKRGLRAGGQNPAIQDLMKMFDAVSKLCRESE